MRQTPTILVSPLTRVRSACRSCTKPRRDLRTPESGRLITAGTLAAVITLVLCSVAHAGTWALVSCSTPAGQPAPIDGWIAGGAGDEKGSLSTCTSAGGAMIAQVGDQVEQPAYQPATWTFAAPLGSTIAGGTLTLGFYTPEGQGYAETPENSYDSADVIGSCQYNTGSCASQWNDQSETISASQTGGSQIFIGAECVAPIEGHDYCQQPGDPWIGADGIDAQTNLYRAIIDLQNGSTPTASGFGGGVLSPDASGTQDLLFTASDSNGPGILNATVSIDGRAVYDGTPDSNGGRCQSIGSDSSGAHEFLYEQPCKQSVAVDIPVNTTTVGPGAHQLRVALTDAAGNSAVVYSTTITTDNTVRVPNGTPCPGVRLSLTVNGRPRLGAVAYGRRVLARGWLHCGQSPVPGAQVDVSGGGKSASVQTNAKGRFGYRVPIGPSRTFTFSYRAYSNDMEPAAIVHVTIRVRPAISLHITPQRTRNGDTINWSGQITGGPYPATGLTLLVQVKAGRRWETFDQLVTHDGLFAYRYTFLRTLVTTTYAFRVAIPVSGAAGYDYVPAYSRTVKVEVSP
jgi:hypothetical protein